MSVSNPKPMHPGAVLASYYMVNLGLNQTQLAEKLGCTPAKINQIVNGKRGITPEFAIALEKAIGTSAEMWVSMQGAYDLAQARKKKRAA